MKPLAPRRTDLFKLRETVMKKIQDLYQIAQNLHKMINKIGKITDDEHKVSTILLLRKRSHSKRATTIITWAPQT